LYSGGGGFGVGFGGDFGGDYLNSKVKKTLGLTFVDNFAQTQRGLVVASQKHYAKVS